MAVIGTFQTYNEESPDGKPWDKEFENEAAMYSWYRDQSGHPWLSMRLLSHKEENTYDDELWDSDENCDHNIIDAPGGGVKCTKCNGWFCY